MSAEQSVVYSQNVQLFTLKGDVTVTFLDGQSFTGRLVKQDMFNLFFLVEGEVRMTSRSQVWYVSAISYSQIGEDTESMQMASEPPAESPPPINLQDAPTVQPDVVVPPEPEPELPPVSMDAYAFDAGAPGPAPTMLEVDSSAPAPTMLEVDSSAPAPTMFDYEAPKTELDFPAPEFDFLDSVEPTGDESTAVLGQAPQQEDEEITYILNNEAESASPPAGAEVDAGTARLVCTGGPHVGESWEFSGDSLTIGRASYNNIALSLDKEISRNHAVIRREGSQFVIEDQDSLNGVFVNQERISTSSVVYNNDVILVGISTLEFMAG